MGGGFAGLFAARALAKAPVEVTVVDRRNHHLFQPLLYQVATAALAAPDIASPIRRVLRNQKNARVLLADVAAVDVAARRLTVPDLAGGTIEYDFLILAPGAVDHYFDHPEWKKHAVGLKSVDDAFEVRRRILLSFEAAEREPDPARRAELLTFVIVGAGPTGVEMAGAIAEIARFTLTRNFRNFEPADSRVVLIEGRERVLPTWPSDLSAKAAAQLAKFRVELRLNARVTAIDSNGVELGGDRIATRTIVWAAGVRASPLLTTLGAPQDRAGRVLVAPDLSVPGHPEVFVIGDGAAVKWKDGLVPGVAPAAMQMGKFAARCVTRRLRGEPSPPFAYRDKGSLATIGRRAAVADFGRLKFSGPFAWLMWLFIHIFFLIGFRNRVVVMIEWALAYFSFQRSARVILEEGR